MIFSRFKFVLLFCLMVMQASAYYMQQQVTIKNGWNAVYLQVAPEASPDELFSDWPTESVGVYDPASFLITRQFSEDWIDDGTAKPSVHMWYRNNTDASTAGSVPAGCVCLFFATNAVTKSVIGVPAAPRLTWHKSDGTLGNYMGISLQGGGYPSM